jgi:hypothetical protein
MPKPLDGRSLPIERPAEDAWKKYKVSQGPSGDTAKDGFMAGWNAALAWLPFRVHQFREIEEALRKEIEDLKRGNPPIDSSSKTV